MVKNTKIRRSQYVRFEYPYLPVSVNKLYTYARGRQILTAAGRKFKTIFIAKLGGARLEDLTQFEGDPERGYRLTLEFIFPEDRIFNPTYGKDKRIKSPFKKVDVTNLLKITEDCISELTGIGDRCNFEVLSAKRVARKGETIGIRALLEEVCVGDLERWL